ncbi:MAG TPA: hypothetical protein DEA80_00300 [Afipia sp.]|uniref:hypothetical protein n=1 Tax=unclassified Afipia TaxID=2642050 RepID=UPI000463A561|nr:MULTISPECIES: hypothetical protein [unclassified Afipia]MAH67777.1 hypothetical protein [Afipia sp.]OUX63146.1 MAG: hypothetical protein CBB64_00835 [Afipia sp. TMED4]HAP47179.1 hypothetical protein [Afipia sp.]HBR43372.1 hypothetical protein [Afipia sp.]
MANEAFALSPISARAASPTDADFEAIREAFLETARGRWFLDEYTRRNRNADTAMVLEAVARIESSLAAQKEEQRQQAAVEIPPVEPPSNELPEAMAAVRAIVAAARESVSASLSGSVFEESLAPSRKCARVIREIAWGLRESGADGRICFLLESQVDAINAACDHVAAGGIRDGVLQAFDQAARQIEAIAPSTIAPQSEAESVAALHVADTAAIEASDEVQIAAADEELFDVAAASESSSPEMATEAVLLVEESLPVEPAIPAEAIEASDPAMAIQLEILPEAPEPAVEIVPEIAMTAPASLGESLIASGIIARPATPRSDPLAPIRRMSQAEKVAFFS